MADSGTLFVVATPIGNLGDMTQRAVETLKDVDVIAAEDTRQTRKLTDRYKVRTSIVSYHAHSDRKRLTELLLRLSNGESVAVVTDAGTPAVSDPGSHLVTAAREAGHPVVPIPGPSALVTALSAAGLGADQFTFLGFLPHKKGRQTKLESLPGLVQPVVMYESPHRLVKLLAELTTLHAEAQVCVARELTKHFEEFRLGKPKELYDWYAEHLPKGEVVVIVRI